VINGSIIDAFEYYFAILEHNEDAKLFLIDFNNEFTDYLISIMEERYYLDDLNWKKNIVRIKRANIVAYNFKRCLIVDYSTINRLRGLLKVEQLDIISELFTENTQYFMSPELYNVTYYGEMPFVYKDKDYRMKMLFDRFKPLSQVKRGFYVHAPEHQNPEELKTELDFPYDAPIFFKREKHMENLFEHFDMYIYYHSNNYFDPHPRLPLECMFYEKRIKYINKFNVKDGSYYRFNDMQANGISNRTLNKDDEIVRQFI
jgi:hypothetical protein